MQKARLNLEFPVSSIVQILRVVKTLRIFKLLRLIKAVKVLRFQWPRCTPRFQIYCIVDWRLAGPSLCYALAPLITISALIQHIGGLARYSAHQDSHPEAHGAAFHVHAPLLVPFLEGPACDQRGRAESPCRSFSGHRRWDSRHAFIVFDPVSSCVLISYVETDLCVSTSAQS